MARTLPIRGHGIRDDGRDQGICFLGDHLKAAIYVTASRKSE